MGTALAMKASRKVVILLVRPPRCKRVFPSTAASALSCILRGLPQGFGLCHYGPAGRSRCVFSNSAWTGQILLGVLSCFTINSAWPHIADWEVFVQAL